MSGYYFDYNATTPVAPEVIQAMMPYFTNQYGNPSSMHQLGQASAKAIKNARKKTAELLGAQESEIIFTSGATESTNAAIRSALALSFGKKEIIISSVEHSSVRKLSYQLVKEGYTVREIGVDADGRLNRNALLNFLNDQVAVVSLMSANNETGVLFPVEEMGKAIRAKGIFFHVDGVQSLGKCRLNLKNSPIDFFSLSAHKFYGPKGIGALYVRQGVPFRPLICGGSQERGRRAGTENLPGIVGLGAASELVLKDLDTEILRLQGLQQMFEHEVKNQIPEVIISGENTDRLVSTSHIRFQNIEAETLLMALDQREIYVSSGAACMSGAHDPSHVLKAMGCSDEDANSSVRFSFGRGTTEASLFVLVSELRDIVRRLRSMKSSSTIYAGGVLS